MDRALRADARLRYPRGIRNNNPGNIERDGTRWQGMAARQTDARFVVFSTAAWGIRAIARVLITYQDRRRAADGSRMDSVRKFIARWAPPVENNTDAYARAVAVALGVGVDDPDLDVYDFETMFGLVAAIIRYENGSPRDHLNGVWYQDSEIEQGLLLAGITRGVVHAPPHGAAV